MLLNLFLLIISCRQLTSIDNESNIIHNVYRYSYLDSDGVRYNRTFTEFRPRHFDSSVFNSMWSYSKIKSLDQRSDSMICLYWYSINQSMFYLSSMKILEDFFDNIEISDIQKRVFIELYVDFIMKINQDLFRDPNVFILRNKINDFTLEHVTTYGTSREFVVEHCFDYFIYTMFTGLKSVYINHNVLDKIRPYIEGPSNQELPMNFFYDDRVVNARMNMQRCIAGVFSILFDFIYQ